MSLNNHGSWKNSDWEFEYEGSLLEPPAGGDLTQNPEPPNPLEALAGFGFSLFKALFEGLGNIFQGLTELAPQILVDVINGVAAAVGYIGLALTNGAKALFGMGGMAEIPELYKGFSDEAFKALEPLKSLADDAIERADKAQEHTESLSEQLTGSINGDLADAAQDQNTIIGKINAMAMGFSTWSEDHQTEINDMLIMAANAGAAVDDVQNIQWQTQAEYNEQNNRINQAQTEALMLHENQLGMLDARIARPWTFYGGGRHPREPWVNCYIYRNGALTPDRFAFLALGSWAGKVIVNVNFDNDANDSHEWIVKSGTPAERETFWDAQAPGPTIKNVQVTIYPYWGNHRREFLLKPDSSGSGGFLPTEAYTNDLEGNPITMNSLGVTRFMNLSVVSDRKVRTAPPSGGAWRDISPGNVLAPGTFIKPLTNHLVKFTEYR